MTINVPISVLRRCQWLLSWVVCAFLWASAGTQAATTNCTPTAGFTACKRITFSGADQSFTVPTGINSIEVRAWGAAGGGANFSWYSNQAGGAGGGYAQGTLAVSAGQVMTIVIGQGGIPNSTASTYGGGGGGGNSTNATAIGGSGGGYSGIFAPGGKTAANARVLASGGGGASPGADGAVGVGPGGGGGSTGGQDGLPTLSGRGGTQVAGGAAATQDSACSPLTTAGSQFQGGTGGSSTGASSNEGGGGGGGGYFGGGGGVCQNSGNQNGGGGGGSSFVTGASVTAGSTTAGSNFLFNSAACSGTAASGGVGNALYTAGVGEGSCYGTGGNGEIVIQYRTATVQVSKTSVGDVGGFSFLGDNGIGSETLTTVTSGVAVSGTAHPLDNSSTATTITESIPAGYVITAINCTGLGSGSATYSLTAGTAALNATATAAANSVVCAFTNAKLPTLQVRKVSNGGTGTFTFTGSNGFGSDSVTTVTPGVAVNGAIKVLTALNTATTLTETIPSAYFLAGLSCSGLGSGIASYNLSTGAVLLDANATAAGNAIVCTYTNTFAVPSLSITKSASTAGPVAAGQVITYTFRVTNSGNRPITGVAVNDTFTGTGTAPTAHNETLTTDAVPAGDSTDSITDDGSWQTLGPGDVITFTGTYTVTQSDIDLRQ